MKPRHLAIAVFTIVLAGIGFAAAGDGEWLQKVPAKDRARPNPFAADADAPAAGAKIFAEHCAACHGDGRSRQSPGQKCSSQPACRSHQAGYSR